MPAVQFPGRHDRSHRTPHASVLLAPCLLCTAAVGVAQNPPLAPTTNTTIVVNGPLQYGSILVPAGVTVRFVRPNLLPPPLLPAFILCDGDAIVHGTLSVGGETTIGHGTPAGVVTLGRGLDGYSCSTLYTPAAGGRHVGTYGAVLPFSLDGGSNGGGFVTYTGFLCSTFSYGVSGGAGGGTLVLQAGGRIEIDGTITADGLSAISGGSGGSILLRGGAGVTVLPAGRVSALGGAVSGTYAQTSSGAPGYIRLDAWGAPPDIQGTITPSPTVLELPFLRSLSQPRIGTSWSLVAFAPEFAAVFVAASPIQGNGAPTPLGPLGIDLPSADILAYAALTPPGHDPFVSVPTRVPNTSALVGQGFWIQAVVVPPALPARLSNTLAVTVQ